MSVQDLHVVVGGTGRAGAAVVRSLVERGRRVRIVNRSGSGPSGVEVVAADVLDGASTRRALTGATVIYNCANPVSYSAQAWAEEFPRLYGNVTAAAAQLGARLVVADNVYMYGPHDGPLTEDLPHRPSTAKGKVRAQIAVDLMAAHDRGDVRVAVGRSTDFYGPACEFVNDTFVRPALAGAEVHALVRDDAPHSLAYIDDVGEGLVVLGEHDEAFGQVWHLPSAPAPTQAELISRIFAAAGTRERSGVVPMEVLRKVAEQDEILREQLDNAYQFDAPFVVDSTKIERAFGVAATPLDEGIAATVDWVRMHSGAAAQAADR